MATAVEMPKQGNTVEECVLTAWRKKVGDDVAAGEIIADIETDKATFEIEAPVAGKLLAVFAEPGALVPVLTNIAVIGNAGEPTDPFKPVVGKKAAAAPAAKAAGKPAPAAKATPAAAPVASSAAPVAAPVAVAVEPAGISHRAKRLAEEKGLPEGVLKGLRGSGPRGRVVEADVLEALAKLPRLSSLAATLVAEKGMRLPAEGSGPGGLIRAEDLLEPGEALSNLRKVVAQRMRESLSSTAQFTASTRADAAPMLGLRAWLKKNAAAKNLGNITLGDMVLFAVIKAIKQHPEVNGTFEGGMVYRSRQIHLGFACDTPRGLLVPVIRDAQDLTLSALSARVKDLAQRAQDGKLGTDELSGGTFTVSNLGSFGVLTFTPILNAPQLAILGVGATELVPERAKDGTVGFVDKMSLSITTDHQILDGAPAARFLQTVVKVLSNLPEHLDFKVE